MGDLKWMGEWNKSYFQQDHPLIFMVTIYMHTNSSEKKEKKVILGEIFKTKFGEQR